MANKPKNPDAEQDTRQRLVKAATEVFAEKGFAGATVKEISDRAGVNISLISYHFNGKEGIFRTCLEDFAHGRLKEAEQVLTLPESKEDLKAKLKIWMQQFLRCHVEDADVCTILHRENIAENKFMWEIFEGTFLKTFEAMVNFLEAARKKGILRKELDCNVATQIIFGFLVHMGRNQEAQKKHFGKSIADDKYRAHFAEQAIGIVLNGALKENV
jgi:TetR/AcrR family transcriptional regulator